MESDQYLSCIRRMTVSSWEHVYTHTTLLTLCIYQFIHNEISILRSQLGADQSDLYTQVVLLSSIRTVKPMYYNYVRMPTIYKFQSAVTCLYLTTQYHATY